MSTTTILAISALISLIAAIISIQYAYWRQLQRLPDVTTEVQLHQTTKVLIRLAQKGGYSVLWFGTKAIRWISTTSKKIFFLAFPSAKKAFVEKNVLTGLSDGPLSYYLKSISEERKDESEE